MKRVWIVKRRITIASWISLERRIKGVSWYTLTYQTYIARRVQKVWLEKLNDPFGVIWNFWSKFGIFVHDKNKTNILSKLYLKKSTLKSAAIWKHFSTYGGIGAFKANLHKTIVLKVDSCFNIYGVRVKEENLTWLHPYLWCCYYQPSVRIHVNYETITGIGMCFDDRVWRSSHGTYMIISTSRENFAPTVSKPRVKEEEKDRQDDRRFTRFGVVKIIVQA